MQWRELQQSRSYINFGGPFIYHNENHDEKKIVNHIDQSNQLHVGQLSSIAQPPISSSSFPISPGPDANEFLSYENWDELRSVVEFACDPSTM
jgi:hypothetical protein